MAKVIVALDFSTGQQALELVGKLQPGSCSLKIGKELFTREGPALVRFLTGQGYDVFLDLKYHDIPNTVARACEAAANLGVWMMNVHASGGSRMMRAAAEALDQFEGRRPLLVGVTVLTSMNRADLDGIGLHAEPEQQVLRLARLAKDSSLDGVVCSPREASLLRAELGPDFLLVTPGVRPSGSSRHDQSRVATPVDAVRDGADYLVIGRPITQAPDPAAALEQINQDLSTQVRT